MGKDKKRRSRESSDRESGKVDRKKETISNQEARPEINSDQEKVPTIAEPFNSELLAYLKKIDTIMDSIEKRLNILEQVERKVNSFESELKKRLMVVDDIYRKLGDQVVKVEKKTKSIDFAPSQVNRRLVSWRNREIIYKTKLCIYNLSR
ncbi:hypothetical protein DPMN_166407 [Dreissena polymorpha]|uniref:Uncharacterized protein n=1 Tax=Dreissena polymorpha TaxID=45954 RepID=A0A9D4IXK2_DREPO|nr:hypothetical protein DPMN_166407 [Dreissena polymorpha]